MAFSRKITRSVKLKTSKSTSLPVMTELSVPDDFRCPISLDLMEDPVTAPTGITYDRRSIERWLDMGNSTCPVTNKALAGEDLIPNHNIRRMIQDWCVTNRSNGIDRIPTPRIPISSAEANQILTDSSLSSLQLAIKVRSLSKESEHNRRCFVSNAAPLVLASAFRLSGAESMEALTEILAALVGLFPFDNEIALLELGSSESLDSILKIMKYGDIGSRLNAVLLVKIIASAGGTLATAITEKIGFIEAMPELIRKPVSMQATKASLVAMFYLITDNERMATKFTELGLIPLILELLMDSDKSMIEKALAVFDGLLGCGLGRETACAHALTIPVLAKKMFRDSDMATEFTVSALWKLCNNCKGSCLVECLQVGLFQKLLLLLQVGCGRALKERATQMLKLMSGCSEKLECVDTVDLRGLNRAS